MNAFSEVSTYQKLGHIVQQIFRGTLTPETSSGQALSLSLEKEEGVRKNGFPFFFKENKNDIDDEKYDDSYF